VTARLKSLFDAEAWQRQLAGLKMGSKVPVPENLSPDT
jgi:hypothetical protein